MEELCIDLADLVSSDRNFNQYLLTQYQDIESKLKDAFVQNFTLLDNVDKQVVQHFSYCHVKSHSEYIPRLSYTVFLRHNCSRCGDCEQRTSACMSIDIDQCKTTEEVVQYQVRFKVKRKSQATMTPELYGFTATSVHQFFRSILPLLQQLNSKFKELSQVTVKLVESPVTIDDFQMVEVATYRVIIG